MTGGRYDSAETSMQNPAVAPEERSPQSLMRDLRDKAARAEVLVVFALVLSICTILFTVAHSLSDIA
jgi:hypothetical protein